MLTDTKLRNLKGAERPYKVADRDGLYVTVSPSGGVSFRYNYRVNGRQETVTLGRYGVGGVTLGEAREALAEARRPVREGVSPARDGGLKKNGRRNLGAQSLAKVPSLRKTRRLAAFTSLAASPVSWHISQVAISASMPSSAASECKSAASKCARVRSTKLRA